MLVREYMQECRGIEIPDYTDGLSEDQKAWALLTYIREHATEVSDPEPGDVVLLKWAGQAAHIGVYVGHDDMLHAFRGIGAHLESLRGIRWRNRVMGYWRVKG